VDWGALQPRRCHQARQSQSGRDSERISQSVRKADAAVDAVLYWLRHPRPRLQSGIEELHYVERITLYGHFKTRADLVDAVLVRTVEQADAILDATDTSGDPGEALARLVASSWQIVHQFRNILLAAQRELPAERIRGVYDRILRRVQSLIEHGQRAGTFRRDLPQQWLVTTAYGLMHAAAEDTAATPRPRRVYHSHPPYRRRRRLRHRRLAGRQPQRPGRTRPPAQSRQRPGAIFGHAAGGRRPQRDLDELRHLHPAGTQ
jgi:AcrR family transcriptional regulator